MAGRRERYSSLSPRGTNNVVAVAVGIFIGFIFAFLVPYGWFSSAPPTSQASSSKCEFSEKISKLGLNNVKLLEKNAELTKQMKELNDKIKLAEQERDHAQEGCMTSGGNSIKAAPYGTDNALRTNHQLSKILAEVSVNKELIVALANSEVKLMLEIWFTNIQTVGIRNYLVVALDDEVEEFCKVNGVPVYRRDKNDNAGIIGQTGGSHTDFALKYRVSALKFRILREFLQLGYSVLLSDTDIIYLQNPFNHLYRDSDVESMTDGYDNITAYGYNDASDEPSIGWSRHAYTRRIWVYNSGFFYIRPTIPSIELLDRVADRLAREQTAWDQAVFNEELFHPSHPGYIGIHTSKRTMDFYLFMNSKVLFKTVRYDPELKKLKPVVVHMNYHKYDKHQRMKAVVEYYVNGKHDALDPFPPGYPHNHSSLLM